MSKSVKNELLEPTGISSSSLLNICGAKPSLKKPKIGEFPKESDTLSKVKSFLPQLKLAEDELKRKIIEGKSVDIEDVGENSKHIEMNVEMFEQKQQWSEDSEPDSPPSPAERDNAFTSDSDSSSSDSVSSSSDSEKSLKLKIPNKDVDSTKGSERPIIEEIN